MKKNKLLLKFRFTIIKIIQKLLYYLALNTKGKLFCFFFKIHSLSFKKKINIFYSREFYFIRESNRIWRFYHKRQGLYAYYAGLENRKTILQEEYGLNKIKFNDEDQIIDCGANNGDFYLCFDKKINYTAIEPANIEFSNLKHNVLNQNLLNKALWHVSDQKKIFYLSGEYADNSIIEISNYSEVTEVTTITLDDIIGSIKKKIKLIKIEAEGGEPEVLLGLKKEIHNVEYITVDCGFERGLEKKSTITETLNYLYKHNFELISFSHIRIVLLFKNKKYK